MRFALIAAVALAAGCLDKSDKEPAEPLPPKVEEKSELSIEQAKVAVEAKELAEKNGPLMNAVAKLDPTEGNTVRGIVKLAQQPGGEMLVEGRVEGLTPGLHGFHIHEKGDCSGPKAKTAGGHFNPEGVEHAGPDADKRHAGDLGNIKAEENGVATFKTTVEGISLDPQQKSSVMGRAFVVHAKADDGKSQPSGAAGDRIACGVIKVESI